jgi:hypothetical protein
LRADKLYDLFLRFVAPCGTGERRRDAVRSIVNRPS